MGDVAQALGTDPIRPCASAAGLEARETGTTCWVVFVPRGPAARWQSPDG